MINLCTFLWDMRDESESLNQKQFVFERDLDFCGKLYYSKDKEQSISIFVLGDKIIINYAFIVEDSIDNSAKYQTHVLKFVYPKDEWQQLREEFQKETLFDLIGSLR